MSGDKEAEIIEAFNSTSRYLDDLSKIDNTYFDGMASQICSSESELQINKTNSILRPRVWIYISHYFRWFVSSTIYEKRNGFDVDIVNVPFLDGDIPRAPSYEVYTSQLVRFAAVASHAADFNTRN